MSIKFEYVEKQSEVIRRVAAVYPSGSEEESALRLATLALLFTTMNDWVTFQRFLRDHVKELTPKQRAELEAMGL